MNSPALVRPPFSRSVHRHGLSLMELLIATTISIMVMGATVTLFGVVGERINGGRAMIEVADRLRSTQNLLHHDLRGVTVSFLPWEQPSAGSGYFEILKGPARDSLPGSANVTLGYTQDVLMFTTRSPDQPFTGRYMTGGSQTTIESPLAEVVWYMQPTFNAAGQRAGANGGATTYTLYRRQFLISPVWIQSPPTPPGTPLNIGTGQANLNQYYDNYDVSAHPDRFNPGNMIANSLADLTYRDNRFAHNNFQSKAKAPFVVNATTLTAAPAWSSYFANSLTPFPVDDPSQRYGEDVVLTNVLSFDVKVWDPGAAVLPDASQRPLVPSDPGYIPEFKNWRAATYPAAWHAQPVQYGAYVDLNYANTPINFGGSIPPSYFANGFFGSGNNGGPFSLLVAGNNNGIATYDSWCQGYEYFHYDIQANQSPNQAYDGFDNGTAGASNGVVDDPTERLSSPPYPVPLRGVQIKIRVYEPSTRQVREVTIAETFLPD